ncbi:MAG: hypothetical protein IPN13_22065 [Bacteroidetes bacterium]|nr:hypothetical protein [Bacteroidota bacterium]
MKTNILILAILCIALNAMGQSSSEFHKIVIQDIKHKGLGYYDTVTTGHPLKEVYIEKGLTVKINKHANLGCDTCKIYHISFINTYNNRPVKYSIGHVGNEDFETALYKWTTDSTVSVTLYQNNVVLNKEYKIGFRDDLCILYGDTGK